MEFEVENFSRHRTSFFEKNRIAFISFVVFVVFAIIGAKSVSYSQVDAMSLLKNQLELRVNQSFLDVLLYIVGGSILEFIIIFLCGMTIFGPVVTFTLLGIAGLKFGIISGGLYSFFGLTGFLCYIVVFLPFYAVLLLIYTMQNNESVPFSLKLSSAVIKGTKFNAPDDFKLYLLRCAVFFGAVIICAIAEAGAGKLFTGFFNVLE